MSGIGRDAELQAVGKRVPKQDGLDMVTGRGVFADDVQLPGMLYGRVLRSPHGHARIRRIDTSRAKALPGVVDVVTACDIPDLLIFPSDEVCYDGENVAVVAAEDPDIAEDALDLIDVDYEVLPAVTDPVAAMAPDSPPARLAAPAGEVTDEQGRRLPNVNSRADLVEGNVELGFAGSDAVVEAEYRTPFFHQTYMEPNASTARVEADGRITVWTSAQGSFRIRDEVAGALKVPHGRIRVIVTKVGGGFGAKNNAFVEPHAALLALRTGRPVKVRINREEAFRDGYPAPGCVVRLKVGARKDGMLMALEGRAIYDGGSRGGGGNLARLRGPYRIPNVRLEGFGVRTNKLPPGAYRAPGAPQAAFARESALDQVARKLGMDPAEFRLKNAVEEGDVSIGGAPLPRVWFKETIRKALETAGWGKRRLKPNQGRGIACGEWNNGSGPSNAFIAVGEDGAVSVVTGQVDITGLHTSLSQIAAQELGVSPDKVTVTLGDTDSVPYTSLSAGSMATYNAGSATYRAAVEARKRVLSEAANFLEAPEDDLEIGNGQIRVKGASDRSVALSVLAASAIQSEGGPLSGQWVVGRIPTYTSYSVDIATVEVDPGTGQVRLIDLVAAQDVGRALNPMLVEGQMQGGATQAIGFGMMEGYRYDSDGRLMNANLLDYPIPTALDMPNIRTVMVEEPAPHGPYGGKGVGEPPIIPGAAAVANAIHDAVGARVTELPLAPERVVVALRGSSGRI